MNRPTYFSEPEFRLLIEGVSKLEHSKKRQNIEDKICKELNRRKKIRKEQLAKGEPLYKV